MRLNEPTANRKPLDAPFRFQLLEEQRFALDRLDLTFQWGGFGIRVLRCHLTRFPPGKVIPFHKHSEYEFHFIPRGKGKVVLGDVEYPLNAGLFYLTGPGVVHSQEAGEYEAMDELCLHLDIQPLPNHHLIHEGMREWGQDLERREAESCISHLAELPAIPVRDHHDAMRWFLTAYRAWYENRHGAYSTIKQAIIQIMLLSIQNVMERQGPFEIPRRPMNTHRYQLATQFMHDNHASSITLSDVADRLHISGRQLQRIFSEQDGRSFQEYLESVRLFYVCRDLVNSRKTFEEIAMMHGFTSSNYAYSVFKKRFSVTPRQYRDSSRQT